MILRYRGQVRVSSWALLGLAGLFGLAGVPFALLALLAPSKDADLFGIAAAVFFIFAAVLYAEYVYLLRPLVTARISLLPDGIHLSRKGLERKIKFDEIQVIERRMTQWAAGYFALVLKDGKRFRFTVVLERSFLLLDAVYAARPDLISEGDYLLLRKGLVLGDRACDRAHRVFSPENRWVTFLILLVPVITLAAFALSPEVLGNLQPRFSLRLIVIARVFIFAAIAYGVIFVAAEMFLLRKDRAELAARPREDVRDRAFEGKIYRWGWVAYAMAIAAGFPLARQTAYFHELQEELCNRPGSEVSARIDPRFSRGHPRFVFHPGDRACFVRRDGKEGKVIRFEKGREVVVDWQSGDGPARVPADDGSWYPVGKLLD
jgi:hypothetical protein